MTLVDPVRPTVRRLDVSGPGTADLVGVRLTVGALLRWSPLVLAAALLGWGLGATVPDLGRTPSANATLGLTDDVRWPFYDAVMARQPALLDDGIRTSTETDLGIRADSVTIDADTGQTDAVMRLVVEADTEDDAIALAQEMAERLVAANLAEQRVNVQERVDRLGAAVIEQQAELDSLDARRDRERLAQDSDAAEITQAELLVIAGDLTELQTQLEGAQEELETMGPRIDIVAPAVGGRNRSDDVRSSAITAALLALLAVGVVPTLERRFGTARHVAQVRRVWPGVPALDERRGSELLGDDLVSLVDGLAAVYPDVVVLAGDDDVAGRVPPSAVAITIGSGGLTEVVGNAGAVVIAIRRGSIGVRRLDRMADELVALGIRPSAVVLTTA